jgi:beta-aspartyl-peptidase (threonine type)
MADGRDPLDTVTSWGAPGGHWALLVHGGAGSAPGRADGPALAGARAAAEAGAAVLRSGGSALDAVQRAVTLLEDDPVFNAGTGACLTEEGLIELDAALMEGGSLRAGGVCALPPFANPIAVARAALDDGRHVLYAGEGAARFARERGFVPSTSEAMTTPEARARWAARREGRVAGGSQGTVGAVARDARGHVASATSTGGILGKRPGRVGDSPLLGAGTYADDDAGAASATGQGEAILRVGLARCAVDSMRARVHPQDAARAAVRVMESRVAGTGGLILVDRDGRLGWARNTASMTWAAAAAELPDLLAGEV